jgi:hypothetical protein
MMEQTHLIAGVIQPLQQLWVNGAPGLIVKLCTDKEEELL